MDQPGPTREFQRSNLNFWRKNEDEKFQQNVYVNQKHEDIVFLIDVMISVNDKLMNEKHIRGVAKKKYLQFFTIDQFSLCFPIFKLKTKMQLYQVVLWTPKASSTKTLRVVEKQQVKET